MGCPVYRAGCNLKSQTAQNRERKITNPSGTTFFMPSTCRLIKRQVFLYCAFRCFAGYFELLYTWGDSTATRNRGAS